MNKQQLQRIPDRLLDRRFTYLLEEFLQARGWSMTWAELEQERRARKEQHDG